MTIVRREGIAAEIHGRKSAVIKEWGRYRTLQRFLADHYPLEWERIRWCRTGYYRTYEAQDREGAYKASARSCHQLPYCIMCVKAELRRRVDDTFDHFAMCTPAGEKMRLIHIVQTAPVYDDGTGWGMKASRDHGAFGGIVWKSLRHFLGDGIGAVMSYQDFGERPFKKRHPHMDLTLNGWAIQDGKAMHTPFLELKGGGAERWNQVYEGYAQAFELGAKRGNLDIQPVTVGLRPYYRALAYQMREMINLRNIEYSRDRQEVHWNDYKSNKRVKYTVHDFMAGIAEYQYRLGDWKRPDEEGGRTQRLHRRYGHLAHNRVQRTRRLVGGAKVPHGKSCPCQDCGDWAHVYLEEAEKSLADVRPLPYRP